MKSDDIVNFDLCFAEWNEAEIFGLYDEFLSSARIDNLVSVYCSIKSLLDVKSDQEFLKSTKDVNVIACFDHEEIGSQTYVGANSEYLKDVLQRITQSLGFEKNSDFSRIIRKSFMLSCDMAHSVHPNFSGIH